MNDHPAAEIFQIPSVNPAIAARNAGHLGKTIRNLSMLLEYEQKMLAENRYTQMEALAADKLRLLGQLETVVVTATRQDIEGLSGELRALREKLARNMKALQFRAKAIGELAQTIEDAAERAQSDGTYDPVTMNRFGT